MSKYIFGPVPSRRYGRSLGIDLVPMKTCNSNCIFCQLGQTPSPTTKRADYVPVKSVLRELSAWLEKGEEVQILTLCGSGEPTLHSHFGKVLSFIKNETTYPSLLMSNGVLFSDESVREDAAKASRVKVSLHSWDESSFQTIMRPAAGVHFQPVIDGYRLFRQQFKGFLDLEVFIIPGVNDAPWQLERIMNLLKTISPDTVTVNTAERPPAEQNVKAVSPEELHHLRQLFSTIASGRAVETILPESYSEEKLIQLARRHQLSVEQFAKYFGQSDETIRSVLQVAAKTDPEIARIKL